MQYAQRFHVVLRVHVSISDGCDERRYMSESVLRRQLSRLFRGRSLLEGLPCAGESKIAVAEAVETKDEENGDGAT